MSILSEKYLLWDNYYNIHNEPYILSENEIELQKYLLQKYKDVICKIDKNIDIKCILGTLDETIDPHLLLYFWNRIFKPYKTRVDYLNYEKVIHRVISENIPNILDHQMIHIIEILLPFVLEIKQTFKNIFDNQRIMINIKPSGKVIKFIKPPNFLDKSKQNSKIDVYTLNSKIIFNNSMVKQYYF